MFKHYWYIEYYFAGPDVRYNGKYYRITNENIDQYIDALKDNFLEYKKIKHENIDNDILSKSVSMDMTIRIAPFSEGVCLFGMNCVISNERQLSKMIESLQYARKKAFEMIKNN